MKNRIFIITVVLLFSMLFMNCYRKGDLLGSYNFTAEDRMVVPYNGGETVILIDSLGDTIKYSINPHVGKYDKYYRPGDPNLDPDHVEMVDYYLTENYQTSATGYFNINIIFSTPFSNPIKKILNFRGLGTEKQLGAFSGLCLIDSGLLLQNNISLGLMDELTPNLQVAFSDSLRIYNKIFYSVYSLTQLYSGHDSVDCIKTVFYNLNQGIVGIKTKKNRVWCLN